MISDRWLLSAIVLATCSAGCATMPNWRGGHAAAVQTPAMSPAMTAAQTAEHNGDLAAARQGYEDILRQSPQDAAAAHRLAVVCTQQGDHARAADAFNLALQHSPTDAELLTDAGYACYVRGEYAAAEPLLNAALQNSPLHERATNNLGLVQGVSGRTAQALATFETVQPRPVALKNVAYTHQLRGEWPQAVACYEQARKLDPQIEIPAALIARGAPPAEPAAMVATTAAASPITPSQDAVVVPVAAIEAAPAVANTPAAPAPEVTETTAFVLPANYEQPPQVSAVTASVAQPQAEQAAVPVLSPVVEQTIPGSAPEAVTPAAISPEVVPPQLATVSPRWPRPTTPPAPVNDPATETLNEAKRTPEPAPASTPEAEPPAIALPAEVFEAPLIAPEPSAATGPSNEPAAAAVADKAETATWAPARREAPATLPAPAPVDSDRIVARPMDVVTPITGPSVPTLMGYCLVTLKDERSLVLSQSEFSAVHEDRKYAFASADAAARFQTQPERYVPAVSGQDPVTTRRGRVAAPGSLDHAAWFRERLYLFSKRDHLRDFQQTPRDFVDNAEPSTVAEGPVLAPPALPAWAE